MQGLRVLAYQRISSIYFFWLYNFYGSFDALRYYLIVFSANFFAINYIILSPQRPPMFLKILIYLGAVLCSCFVF
jgi:hypothetical protein